MRDSKDVIAVTNEERLGVENLFLRVKMYEAQVENLQHQIDSFTKMRAAVQADLTANIFKLKQEYLDVSEHDSYALDIDNGKFVPKPKEPAK
jgi:hypothetical protein